MRPALAQWVRDAEALDQIRSLGLTQRPADLLYVKERSEDYYISLVGELFDRLRAGYDQDAHWARLGNALTQAGDSRYQRRGRPRAHAALFAAAAFYFGGYPASAYVTLKGKRPVTTSAVHQSCYELLTRPSRLRTPLISELLHALDIGDADAIKRIRAGTVAQEQGALETGPEEWIAWRLFGKLLNRFEATNIRAALPDGQDAFWNPLVQSFLSRKPPVWDFFPSQIEALDGGLLEGDSSYSLQMPTGAGKTAITETLLFYQLAGSTDDAAILLVPYRSLASELRKTLVRRLREMGIATRCIYGGTVPSADETRQLPQAQAVVGTPEALSGLLNAQSDFLSRVSLVVCDEGHLLAGGSRGVGLELLLTRLKTNVLGPPRFVFISAIVPNIEEINAWLGGTQETVLRSNYQPATAEFSRLAPREKGRSSPVDLEVHPHEAEPVRYSIRSFLTKSDFQYINPKTGRSNTYPFASIKTRAIASARKALPMGTVAVFSANKHGNQGVVGLAQELLSQLGSDLPMPTPLKCTTDPGRLAAAVDHLVHEYGSEWTGTQALEAGAVLHHGDVPQESREVLEDLVRDGVAPMALCTNTLAEGVNLPLRTLVLYSVRRLGPDGRPRPLRTRDIKNLVGRAGRPGSETKGLVICANHEQWQLVAPVAKSEPGERVVGALLELMLGLRRALRQRSLPLTNRILEISSPLHTLVDGIDATLVELASEEIGETELARLATGLARETFAAQQATTAESVELMETVFSLRARRIAEVRDAGRLDWIRDTGAQVRMLDSVEAELLPARQSWEDIEAPDDPSLIGALIKWSWNLPSVRTVTNELYRGL